MLKWIFLTSSLFVGIRSEGNWGVKTVPTTVETFQNNTVILPCYVDDLGESPTAVRWWRDGVQLAASGDSDLHPPHRIKMHGNMSLEISRVQPEDTGQYLCQATRPAPWGHITQAYAIQVKSLATSKLGKTTKCTNDPSIAITKMTSHETAEKSYMPSVIDPPKITQTLPESGELDVNIGDEVDMSCIANGHPAPTISWKMKEMDMQLLDDRPRLRFHAENRSLAGRYTCVASNGIGEPAQSVIELRIKHKPEIETRKRWVHVSPGIRTQLDCKVTAWPEAQVDWYLMNEKIVYDSRIVKHTSGQMHSLVIRNVRQLDYGFYLCRASNYLGTSGKVIELSGVANPAVIKGSRSIGRNAYYFVWEVDSYSPIVEYQFWFRNYPNGDWHKLFIPSGSEAIGPLHAKSFNLTGLEEASHYEALVLSRNRYGWSGPSNVLRFATEGALVQSDERFKVGKGLRKSATDNSVEPMYPEFMDSGSSLVSSVVIVPILAFITTNVFL